MRRNEEISQPTGSGRRWEQKKTRELTEHLMSRFRGASHERVGFARGRAVLQGPLSWGGKDCSEDFYSSSGD